MALSNKERVGRILEILRDGLIPFIIREYRNVYKEKGFVNEMDSALGTNAYAGLPNSAWDSEEKLTKAVDVHSCLNLMWRRWNEVFKDKLGHQGRSYVSELMEARNNWAHQGSFSNDEAYRVADTARRLLKMISAGDQVGEIDEIADFLLRKRFEREAEKSKKEKVAELSVEKTTLEGLKNWREIIQPHPDVASGRYIKAEFAADFAQVLAGTAESEYQDPEEFFARTYLTDGLLDLLVSGVKRLTAQGGDPVIQLQTAFGGGKTHSMMALYHLTSGKLKLDKIPDGDRLAELIGNVDLPEANQAVMVGTDINPAKPRVYKDVKVNTLWGEIAYQLGGKEGYEIVAESDQKGVSPGADTLCELFFEFGPCLIIIDELIAYTRNLYGADRLPSGSFDTILTFIQALTEAVRRSEESVLLISIPASDIEIGGEAGKKALDSITHTIGRIEAVWKPVSAVESFEIVRRRLFTGEIDYPARDAVVDAFINMYHNEKGDFPTGVDEGDYRKRMTSSYPIHPELFDRLYQDWSTLDKFQKTRGVLRFMAGVIHRLWSQSDPSLMIMPGTLPLYDGSIRDELLRYLPDVWEAVFDTDIDGPESRPFAIDGEVPAIGRYQSARRVARTIFIGSAPSVAEQKIRGVEEVRIRLGCAQPGEPSAIFGDAIRRMNARLMYLYSDGSRYWYDTRPTVNKLARDRAQDFSEADVNLEIAERLNKVSKKGDFTGHHVAPKETSDVVDEPRVRIVVLSPQFSHKRSSAETSAQKEATAILEQRGTAQRLYKNMLVFIAPDEGEAESLRQAVRTYLAWKSIDEEKEQLNLDAQQRNQVKNSVQKNNETAELRVLGTYSWLLVPYQAEPLGEVELQGTRISGDDNFYDRASRRLGRDGLLITQWSPDILKMELDKFIWKDDIVEVKLKQIWEYLAQYCYFPRLYNQQVLEKAILDGVTRLDAPFAYCSSKDKEGYHRGLIFRSQGTVYFDNQSLIIHPEHIKEPPEVAPVVVKNGPKKGGGIDEPPITPEKKLTIRYYGRAAIDPKRVNKVIGNIVEEVLEHLTSDKDCTVNVSLEIEAKKTEGFSEDIIRTVSENCHTLKFDDFGFEEE